jgi:hypothetical protein
VCFLYGKELEKLINGFEFVEKNENEENNNKE